MTARHGGLVGVEEASRRILAGETLLLAGEEEILLALPPGRWIGGTIPYFMTDAGGLVSRQAVFATPMPPDVLATEIVVHDESSLRRIAEEAPENGFTFLILPSASRVHLDFAHRAPSTPGQFLKPLLGWVAGTHLDDLASKSPRVVDGRSLHAYPDRAVALHATLPDDRRARIGIVNLFRQGDGPVLTFPHDAFAVQDCLIDGKPANLARWVVENAIDTRLPLVADYNGVPVNVAFQAIDTQSGETTFYAPVFEGVGYRIAEPVPDYVHAFTSALPTGVEASFSCNCVLNFLYSELEGRVTPGMKGPFTFGEIAYQVLSQTLVYLVIEKRTPAPR